VWYGNDDYSPTNRLTGGALPAQTWHDIMVAAHQGIEIKELAGVGMGIKNPAAATSSAVAANAEDNKPGPPPVLTRRGADVLLRVEKMLDDAGKTMGTVTSNEAAKSRASSALAFPESYASANDSAAASPAAPAPALKPASRKN
jgi:penicillin-binding protein 1A